MSDLYDSLEDEKDEKNTSADSLNECKTDALDSFKENSRFKNTECRSPFYLNRNVTEEKPDSILSFEYDNAGLQRKNFLPKIENLGKGWDPASNLIVDNEILKEQGLQINDDGSFTKSPRPLADELPFITREYKNLQFQKKKTYRISKKMPRAKIYKKNLFSFTKNPVDGISMNKIISARREKGSSEEILTSAGSLSSRLGNCTKDGEIIGNDNLTDSMKEQMLGQPGNSCEMLKTLGGLKKTKRVMNLLENRKGSQTGKSSNLKWQSQRTNAESKQNSLCNERSVGNQKKTVQAIPKQRSDIVLNGFRPSLSYSERRQLESGFNPLHLRQGRKKILSDTSRSNFGDSTGERLSEVSSRVLSAENLFDEDEELFYRELIQKDKSQKSIQRSSRSEGPNQFPRLNSSVEYGSCKEQKEVKQNTSGFKSITKSMSIDLPSEPNNLVQTLKKYPHYCSADSSPNMSKFELALKAKTYGYMVNARNIFKMKAQSEGKLSLKGEKNWKVGEKTSSSEKKALDSGKLTNAKNFASKSILPEIREKLPGAFEKTLKNSKPTFKVKNCEASKGGLHSFALPRVPGAESRDTKIQMEILNRISSCLNSQDAVSSTVK